MQRILGAPGTVALPFPYWLLLGFRLSVISPNVNAIPTSLGHLEQVPSAPDPASESLPVRR